LVFLGIFGILLIQSIKHEYRDAIESGDAVNRPGYFFSLLSSRVLNPSTVFQPERLYSAAVRGNQGFLMARTIDYVPKYEPYAKGETIIKSITASFVPRVLWPDKPILGGKENTCRFLGDCAQRSYSYNIGQIGEGYVNFGPVWNILYMLLYGLFINWSLYKIRKISFKYPTIILWIPLLYFAALSLETDLLTFLNTFIKGILMSISVYIGFRIIMNWKI
jgi:hypothetical protein